MKLKIISALGLGVVLGLGHPAWAQDDYSSLNQLNSRLQTVARNSAAELQSLTKTEGGKDIWMLRLGKGDHRNKPAIAVTGGVEGYHLLGVELAVQFAEKLIQENEGLLDNTTFYIFPNMSPDAYEQYFSSVKYERRGNAAQIDHDRDGRVSEDHYDDLNKDGMITMMRIESPMGDHKVSSENDLLMTKADRSKGERGTHLYMMEGVDRDKDGQFNEDPEEGIAFNKNLTYKFPAFEPLAGDIPVSQPETRALLDFLFEHNNIFAFVTFGPANNLSSPLSYNAGDAKKRVVTSMLEKDVELNKMISSIYNETTSLDAYRQDNKGTDGDFFQWAYFHFGRLSFSTPGWWIPEMKKEDNGNYKSQESNFMAWAEDKGLEDVFVDWTAVEHPDFQGQKVEVGGIKPFVMHNPPMDMVPEIAGEHKDFIIKLAELQPSLEFHNLKAEKLNNGLTRVTVDLYNNSPLPTHTEMGERSRWLQKIRIDSNKDKDDLVSGDKIKLVDSLGAFEKKTLSYIVKGSGTFEVRAGAPHTGIATLEVKL
ncbi:peptidase [Litoribacter ruber]|uniref:M14 family metallopeptidase n=1 Tax=Litoribacter ruber TaxID=702568 RepID=UPI001BDA71EF|nr:M14 family metallopeptidase [Litoribacter ruber]MBT0809955.1 peptidase [Litoribacter ruber]